MKISKKNSERKDTSNNQQVSFFEKNGKNSFFQVHPKLKIGDTNDRFEQEANQIAEQVVNKKPLDSKNTSLNSTPNIQSKSNSDSGVPVSNNFQNQLQKTTNQGQSLPTDTLKNMNKSFGKDFSNVKIHTDASSEKLNQDIDAKAFTYKNNIYFNKGNFQPNAFTGKKLLAHELTHVVQQQFSAPKIQRNPEAEAKKEEDDTIAKEKEEIITAYKLKGIVSGDKSWTLAEVKQLKSSLSLLPDGDKKMIEQVEFKRVKALSGSTVGQFESNQSVTDTTVIYDKTIKLEDGAFGKGSTESSLIIVHEVGHAVASFERREAVFEQHTAMAENNKLVTEAKAITKDKQPFYDDFEASRLAFNALIEEHKASKNKTERAALKKQIDKDRPVVMKKQAIWKAKEKLLADKNDEIETAEETMKDKKDLADKTKISAIDLKKIKDKVGTSKSTQAKSFTIAKKLMDDKSDALKTEANTYASAIDTLNKGIEDLSAQTNEQTMKEEEVEKLIVEVEKLVINRDKEKLSLEKTNKNNPALTLYTKVETQQDDWYYAVKAQSLAHQRSARVQKFVDFVETNNIDPITPYATENWPHKPEEFYAEAYSWFFVKPTELAALSTDLHQWFVDKNYKK
ncbi:MAG: DUF4157 domain-containing protein [Saprospiraceae bacterium]